MGRKQPRRATHGNGSIGAKFQIRSSNIVRRTSTGVNLSDRLFDAKKRAFHALARMRRDELSLTAAAREEGTTPETVKKYFPAALRRSKEGTWIATKDDRYIREVVLPGTDGPVIVRAHGYKEAQIASYYLASLARWARTEKSYELTPFQGTKIGGFSLVTDPRALRPLRDSGLLQLDSLYAALKDVA